ncbi:MAG: hypothetical protein AAGA97_02885 [Pseudomonadota bacterium]
MFKPTLAAVDQFRETFSEALSGFVITLGTEDGGFTIKIFYERKLGKRRYFYDRALSHSHG